jgi:molecular chaperone HscB
VEAERNTAMPPEFLLEQMAWREALDEADGDVPAVEALDAEVAGRERVLLQRLAREIDETGDARAAAATVRALMFVGRFREDIGRRLEALDA